MLVLVVLAFSSVVGADELSAHPPCVFNPLCTCSRSDNNLGDVTCQNVPLAKLPSYLNRSKINSLRLSRNGFKKIDSHFLSGTGLHMLKISRNSLYDIESDALKGLENSLRDLELSYTELIRIPSHAFNGLQRLQILNLSGNDIVDVSRDNWLYVGHTLEVLILRENAVRYVPAGAFEKLVKLKILDLSANTLIDIDADAFLSDSTSSLTHLYLADNQLRYIPYVQLRTSRALRTLDLDYNFIDNLDAVPDSLASIPVDSKLVLQSLRLRYNAIRNLTATQFRRFSIIDNLYLDGNLIANIQHGTFDQLRVHHLSLASCDLSKLDARMLHGLEETLASLDLSGNDLFALDSNLLGRFIGLRELKTLGNSISHFPITDTNGGSNLVRLEVGGGAELSGQILLRDISKIKSLISITISNVEIAFAAPHHFVGYGFGVEELTISKARMKSIHAHAFIHVRGLKSLDLSDNELHEIDENAFTEIGHSLNTLRLSHAFAKDVKILPDLPMKRLIGLKLLDISFNSFEEIPITSFHSMSNLERIRIHDCQIKDLNLGTFQSDVHVRLKEITFSFNQLNVIKSFTFTDLPELRYLNLEENSVRTIETRAFSNLNKLRWLYLRGNRLETIEQEAFSSLPELELVDLAFNNLKKFELIALDEMVGSSTFLNLNLSFNEIHRLSANSIDTESEVPSLNVKILDLSGNHISDICKDYFVPIENTLTHLYLSGNRLTNASRAVFGSLSQLQWLDLSSNYIGRVDPDTLRETDEIQILNLGSNSLYDLPPNLFHGMKNLRVVDLSDNRLNFLSEYSFREDSLEVVRLARNRFVRIPFKSFTPMVAASLRELDLSSNSIDSLYSPEFRSAAIFKSLTHMNVSSNKISRLDSQILIELPNLLSLDLSHNRPLQFVEQHSTFDRFEENLRCLSLRNTSLTYVPHLPFQKLVILVLSDNNLTTILPEAVANLTSVRVLDLSRNNFTSIPVAILSMKNLKVLNVSSNHIRTLVNNSILGGLEELRELDISYLPLRVFETGALGRLTSLRTLYASTYSEIHNFKFSRILGKSRSLRSLHLHVSGKTLDEEMEGQFPKNVREILIYGSELENVGNHILSGFSSPQFSLTLFGTSVGSVPYDLFRNVDLRLQNITVDVRNNAFKYLANPSSGLSPGLFGRTFLVSLKISRNLWTCRCDIGWIETWSRVRRQILCRHVDLVADKSHHECLQVGDDLRMTRCEAGKSLLQAMQFELEWPILQVNAVLKDRAFLPCDISPTKGDDSATLVLWYKDTVENPVYSFDKRKGIQESKSHWQDNVIFKGRAYFTILAMPTGLSIQDVEEKDAGYYRCRVDFNHSPTKNQKLHLNVIVPPGNPSIYDENGNNLTGTTRAYEEGATMTLRCVSRGGRPRPQLQWWREGTLLESHSMALPNDVDPDASSVAITVTNLNRSHFHTTYSCQAFNNNITAPAAKTISVNMFLAPLEVAMTSNAGTDDRFSAERTYTVECRALGSVPPAKITWWKNDSLVDHSSVIETFVENASVSVLTFVPKREDHGAFLKCSATNPNVKVWRKEASIKLNVAYVPDVSLVLGPALKADDIKEDQDVYFICEVDANPPIYKLVWKHNGVDIQQNVKNEIMVNGKSLVLRSVKKESMGNYSCVASNVEGDKKSNSVELRVSYKPVCKPNQKLVYGAARDENIQVVCEVDSNPEPDTFKWSFNHSQQPIPDKFYSRVDKRRGISILTFTPKSEMDFGYLTCSATNQVGPQVLPCHFQVIPAAAPYAPHNCTIGNVTTVSLEVRCREGFDGGLQQSFWLEVINSTTGSVVLNVSAPEPYFKLSKLAPGNSVQVKVYAANVKGRSQPFELEGSTLKAEKHTGPQNVFVTPLLGIVGCVSVLLILLILGLCLAKCTSAPLSKSRRPTSLCIKEKATHASLLENHERDEKDPDLIPVKKSTGYQVLRTDAHLDEEITKSMTLPASSIQLRISDETDLVSDDEQLSFIDRSEKLPTSSSVKENIPYVNGDNT